MRPVLLAALSLTLGAADIAVVPPPTGSDSNAGTVASPYATLAKALSRAGGNDTIHLLRGATYRERPGLDLGSAAIASSGPADAGPALITTSLVVPTLAEGTDGIFTAKVSEKIEAVWVDGVFCRLARFPNQGWLRNADGSTADRIQISGGQPKASWRGAQLRWRRWSWWWETRPITGVEGTTLRLGPEGRFKDDHTGIGAACYVDNCLAELDAPGEWCQVDGVLHLKPPAGSSAKPMVEIALGVEDNVRCGAATVRGVGFVRMAGTALKINGKATIDDCLFNEIEVNAIEGSWNAGGTQIRNCRFRDVRNVAIHWNESPENPGTVFSGNLLERIGMEFGYGGSGSWHAAGIIVTNGAVTVRENRIVDTGYAGIILGHEGITVERNVFVRCMGSLNDGAAIYANASKSIIRDNIVLDTVGNLSTSHLWYPLGHGIWPEFLSDFREQVITGNTVVGSGGNGLFLTNNYRCTIRDNVFADNRIGALHLSGHGKTAAQDHTIADNVLIAITPGRRPIYEEHIPGNWSGNDRARCIDFEDGIHYGTMSGTTLIASPNVPIAAGKGRSRDFQAVADLAIAERWADPQAKLLRATSLLLINDTAKPHAFPAPRGGWSGLDGKAISGEITVEPFRTAVLVRAAPPDQTPPYVLASGIDYRGPDGGIGVEARPAAEVAATKTAAKPRAARPAATSAVADPAAQTRWMDLLRQRTAAAIAAGKPPRFTSSLMRSEVAVLSVDGDQATINLPGSGAMQANLFGRLAPSDGASLAAGLTQGTSDSEGHALAAFFARLAKDQAGYREHLALAGDFAAEVEGAFAAD